jgi:hypothetical protein
LTGNGALSGATATSTSEGAATFTGLAVSLPGTGDALTVTLPLNPALTNNAPSITAGSGNFSVLSAATTTAATSQKAIYSPGNQNLTLAATVSNTSETVNEGTVTFTVFSGATPIGTAVNGTVSNGAASASYTLPGGTGAGTYTIRASYSDTGGVYAASSDSTQTIVVGQATATVSLSNLAQTYTGAPLAAIATTSPAGLNVALTYNGSATAPTAAGSYSVQATIASSEYTGTASGTLVINKAEATITVTPYNVTYNGNAHTATGTATGADGANLSADLSLSATTHTAAGTYPADAWSFHDASGNYLDASGTVNDTIGKASLTVTAANVSRVYGAANPTFSGTIIGAVAGDTLTESFTTTATISSPVGTYAIVPSVAGTNLADYTPTLVNGTLDVTQAGSTTTLSVSSTSITPGQSVTLTATVASTTSGTPTGTVSFYDNGTLLNTTPAPLSADTAQYATTTLAPGIAHTVTATYSGDTNFTGSSSIASSSTNITVAPLDFTLTLPGPATYTVVPGGSITYTIMVAPDYGSYAGPVTFVVNGLPAGATAAFSPSSIPANGGPQTVTVTITTAPATAGLRTAPTVGGRRGGSFALALLLLIGLGGLRRCGRALRRSLPVLILLTASAAALITGCGGTGYFAQAPQNYTVTITAISGSLKQSATITLNVQ